MAKLLGFGDGSDGSLTISSSTTFAPIDSTAAGTSGSTSLTATNASFASGQMILIHQTMGTGAGERLEVNKISSYTSGTITTTNPLTYTYSSTGDNKAQVLVLQQYGNITISDTLTAKAWDVSTGLGGVVAYLSNGTISINSTISGKGKGFAGGAAVQGASGKQGDSATGPGSTSTAANGSAGGGGNRVTNAGGSFNNDVGSGGGGASNGTEGEDGGAHIFGVSATGGVKGAVSGTDELTVFTLGAGGGSGGADAVAPLSNSGAGGNGGAIVYLIAPTITGTGTIDLRGNDGGSSGSDHEAGGGAGAGGNFYALCRNFIGTNMTLNLAGGTGGTGCLSSHNSNGGDGGDGRYRIDACSIADFGTKTVGSTDNNAGGHSYCQSLTFII